MNRRQFLEAVAVGLVAAPALGSLPPGKLPTRALGRTGLRVPILGFGSGSRFLMYKDEDKAIEALNRAIDLGITYIDTAHAYGDGKSEERIGRVMATRRKEVTLATKIPARTADQARRQIELSLKRLRTDHLEVLHIHVLKNAQDLAAIEARGAVCWRRSTKPASRRRLAQSASPVTPTRSRFGRRWSGTTSIAHRWRSTPGWPAWPTRPAG